MEVFKAAPAAFPDSPSLGAFDAITPHAAGRSNESIASLLDLLVKFVRTSDIDRYKPATSGNTAYIRALDGKHM